jgi:hypothetical protein
MGPQDDNDDFNMNPFSMGVTNSRPKTSKANPEVEKIEEKKTEEKKGLLNKLAEKVILHKEESIPKKEDAKVGGLSLADDDWDLGAIAAKKPHTVSSNESEVAEFSDKDPAYQGDYSHEIEVSDAEFEKSLAMVGISEHDQEKDVDAMSSSTQGDDEHHQDDKKSKKKLGEALIDLGLLSEDQLQVALKEQRATRKLLGQVLIEMGFITESTMA